jgi:hypothetical protein
MRGALLVTVGVVAALSTFGAFSDQSGKAEVASAPASSSCDRACLNGIMAQYLAALLKHHPSGLPLAANVKSTENTKATPLGEGVWKTAKFIKFHGETVADPRTGQVTYWGAIQEDFVSLLYVRLKVVGGKITEVETIVPHGSDPKTAVRSGFDVIPDLQLLAAIKPFLEREIPPSQRASREKLIAAANAYFDGIERQPGHVPFAAGCNRIENGQLTTNNPANSEGLGPLGCQGQFQAKLFTYIPQVRDRRFLVVDESRGLVVANVVFDIPGRKNWIRDGKEVPALPAVANPRSNVLNELFRVDDGQIQLIQAFMLANEPYGTQTGWGQPKP